MIRIKFYCITLLLVFVFAGCRKEFVEEEMQNKPTDKKQVLSNVMLTTSEGNEGLMEFANETQNPYTIANMLAAYQELQTQADLVCNIFNIRVTHKYIKFKPQNSDDIGLLLQDTTLILFDYPLLRKLTKAGTYYRDPSLTDNELNYQWTCVPIDKGLPSVPYDVLAEVYIPEEDPQLVQYYNTPVDECITELLMQALKRTNNFDTTQYFSTVTSGGELGKRRRLPEKYTPAGRITMSDDVIGQIPIKGCKVKVVRGLEIRETLTNHNGDYNLGHEFRFDVNYSIKWERNDFEIRHMRSGQAYFNGPNQRGNWNLNITSDFSRMYAIIHRAAHRYYYEGDAARANLRTPPLRTTMLGRITIGAFDWENVDPNGDCAMIKRWLGFPEIRIFKPSRSSMRIYATTIHELVHASHWNLGKNDYTFAQDIVVESWARGGEWAISRIEYPSFNAGYGRMNYTGVVQDMVDGLDNVTTSSWWDRNKSPEGWGSPDIIRAYNDQVTGYTVREIEDAIIGQRTWSSCKDNIKSRYNNATENNLDNTFGYWDTK